MECLNPSGVAPTKGLGVGHRKPFDPVSKDLKFQLGMLPSREVSGPVTETSEEVLHQTALIHAPAGPHGLGVGGGGLEFVFV